MVFYVMLQVHSYIENNFQFINLASNIVNYNYSTDSIGKFILAVDILSLIVKIDLWSRMPLDTSGFQITAFGVEH